MNIWQDLKSQYRMGGLAEKLIYWNLAAFVLSIVFFFRFAYDVFDYPVWMALSSKPQAVLHAPWTLLTYAFLHDRFLHVFFNMMVLNFASRLFLTYFTQKQFLGLYLLAALFSGLAFVGTFYLLGQSGLMVGASGAIMGILVAVTVYSPLMPIRLLLIGNIRLWHLTACILLLDLLQLPVGNFGGHIAHLGGALMGFIYMKLLQHGTDLSKGISRFFDAVVRLFKPASTHRFKKVHVSTRKTMVAPKPMKGKTQQQIDDILDKISKSGYDSLSKEEKEFLFRAGK